ncbi:hypothetical protein D3C78_1668860 [compost metagenome]
MGQFAAHAAQTLKSLAAGIAQPHTGICEFQAAPILDEQADPQMRLQHFQLPADRTMGDVQLLRRLTDAVQTGRRLEGAQGVERGKVVAHFICEFS